MFSTVQKPATTSCLTLHKDNQHKQCLVVLKEKSPQGLVSWVAFWDMTLLSWVFPDVSKERVVLVFKVQGPWRRHFRWKSWEALVQQHSLTFQKMGVFGYTAVKKHQNTRKASKLLNCSCLRTKERLNRLQFQSHPAEWATAPRAHDANRNGILLRLTLWRTYIL